MKLHTLRSFNWRTAAWEFTVIVTGILVALAVDRWNEARSDRALERTYESRIESDLRADLVEFAGVLARIEASYEAAGFLLGALALAPAPRPEGLPSPGREWTIGDALDMAGRVSLFAPASGTYDELVATGNLRVLRSDAVRAALAAYYLAAERERLYDPILEQAIWIRYHGALRDAGITSRSGYRDAAELRRVGRLSAELEGVREALAQQHAFLQRVGALRAEAALSMDPR